MQKSVVVSYFSISLDKDSNCMLCSLISWLACLSWVRASACSVSMTQRLASSPGSSWPQLVSHYWFYNFAFVNPSTVCSVKTAVLLRLLLFFLFIMHFIKLRVPDQNGVSQAWYTAEIHHSGWQPSTYKVISLVVKVFSAYNWGL